MHVLQEQKTGSGSLYILDAQFEHEGWYDCQATTVYDSVNAKAFLTVVGQLSLSHMYNTSYGSVACGWPAL